MSDSMFSDVYRDLGHDAFERKDESDDSLFYARDRFVSHLDTTALSTVESLIEELVVQPAPAILDLMASWDSHLPQNMNPLSVTGLGLNLNELLRNEALTERIIHDINANSRLPFEDGCFDVVLNTVSVDYMVRPFEIFREVGRVLRPDGLFLVIFSNRMFPTKAAKIWVDSSETGRVVLVKEYFLKSCVFNKPEVFISKGKPRPPDDKYASHGIPSDPIYAVYAKRL